MSKKRVQAILEKEAFERVKELANEANKSFSAGSISMSDVLNEMALTAKIDLKLLQSKHTDIRKSLRALAGQDEVDLESVIQTFTELKNRVGNLKKSRKKSTKKEMFDEF